MKKNKKNKKVSVIWELVNTLAAIADGLSATAFAAIIASFYFGEFDVELTVVLVWSLMVLVVVSVWLKSLMSQAGKK
jgi:hypothetical protein